MNSRKSAFVLPKNALGKSRQSALGANILIATVISDMAKTMIGPRGMYKMLVNPSGEIIITNDGRIVLEKMMATNPIARTLIDLAKTQDDIVGDGTKTVVLIAGELLKKAEKLLDKNIHPTVIIQGYKEATERALKILDQNVKKASPIEEETLSKVASTVICGMVAQETKGIIADIITDAVRRVAETKTRNIVVDVDSIGLMGKAGKGINDSQLINGLILYKSKPHSLMPTKVKNARIALLGCSLDPLTQKATDWEKNYVIERPEELRIFINSEKEFNKRIVNCLKSVGTNLLLCRKRISEQILGCFAEEGIIALSLVDEKDMSRLERATGGKIISSLDDITEKDLGWAGSVEFRKISEDEMLFIEQCKDPKATTILIRGGSEQIVEDLKRVIEDGCKVVGLAMEDGRVVPGGGAIEMEIAKQLREYSEKFIGKEQLAIEAFSDAMEEVPKALASNAGLNAMDVLIELRTGHAKGLSTLGLNAIEGRVKDVLEDGLLDVFKVKQHAIKTASEAASLILKIDDVFEIMKINETKEHEAERQRKTQEKINKALKEEKELLKVEKEVKERMRHPETL